MTKLSTMGTRSCATMAISGFKAAFGGTTFDNKGENDKWLDGTSDYNPDEHEGMTVGEFRSNILYPTKQDLGETKDYPFEMLMDEIEKAGLDKKMIIATLSQQQQNSSSYWPDRLKEHGFVLQMCVGNDWGSDNYIYIRAPLQKDIPEQNKEEKSVFS